MGCINRLAVPPESLVVNGFACHRVFVSDVITITGLKLDTNKAFTLAESDDGSRAATNKRVKNYTAWWTTSKTNHTGMGQTIEGRHPEAGNI